MKKKPSNGRCKSEAGSQESEVAKEKITYESALRAEGIDEAFVARKLKNLLRAKRQRWNPKKESWDKFEDYGTQLAAIREMAKIFGIYGKDSEGTDVPSIINISAIPRRREPVLTNGEQSIGTAAGDGRERRRNSICGSCAFMGRTELNSKLAHPTAELFFSRLFPPPLAQSSMTQASSAVLAKIRCASGGGNTKMLA